MPAKTSCLIVLVLSIALLIPGLTLPMMTLQAEINEQSLISHGKTVLAQQGLPAPLGQIAMGMLDSLKMEDPVKLIDKTQSILGTSHSLFEQGYPIVALLIITFSTVFPLIKLLLLGIYICIGHTCLLRINQALSKWSMADVFAIGVLISFLMATAAEKDNALIVFKTQLHAGFYCFIAYCLFSVATGWWLTVTQSQTNKNNTPSSL